MIQLGILMLHQLSGLPSELMVSECSYDVSACDGHRQEWFDIFDPMSGVAVDVSFYLYRGIRSDC